MKRFGYGWKRAENTLAAVGVDAIFIDTKPERPERNALFDAAGIRPGDVVKVLSFLDLGGSQPASDRIAKEIENRGATVEVVGTTEALAGTGRPRKFSPTQEQDDRIAEIWFSPVYSRAYKLRMVAEIMGEPIPPNRLYYRYGSVDAPKGRWLKDGAPGVDG